MKSKISEGLGGGSRYGVSQECPKETPTIQGGGAVEGRRRIFLEGGVSHSGSAVVNLLPGVSGQIANPNCES